MIIFCGKDGKSIRVFRGLKTVFFLIFLLFSFLAFTVPVLLAVADSLIPFYIFSASVTDSLSSTSLVDLFQNFCYTCTLIDIPVISVTRSAVIICAYSFCDRPGFSRVPYLGVTTLLCIASSVYVSVKASFTFGAWRCNYSRHVGSVGVALFISSIVFAVAHIVAAYRTSCKERRKLLIYKIDIEAVSLCAGGFTRNVKLFDVERERR